MEPLASLPRLQSRAQRATLAPFSRDPLERWQRNFLAIWPGLFAVSTGVSAVLPGLPLYMEESFGIRDREAIRTWSALVFGAGPFCAAVMGPIWGSIGDRLGRKAMVLRSILAIAVLNALMPFAPSPMWLMVLRAVQGVFAGYVAPGIAMVSAGVPPGRQGRVIAWLQVALASGLLAGPPLAAEVAEYLGRAWVFWFTAVVSGLAALPVLVLAREDRSTLAGGPRDQGLVRGFFTDLRYLAENRLLAALLVLLLVMRLGQNMIEPMLALWVRELGPLPFVLSDARDREHAIDRTVALAYTILAVAQIVCTPLWGRLSDRTGPLRCLAAASLGLGGALLATGYVRSIEGYLLLRGAAALFMAGVMTLAYAAASRRVPPGRRSLAFALVQSCIQFGLSLGPVLGAALVPIDGSRAGDSGVRGLFAVAATCLLVAGVGMVLLRLLPARYHADAAVPAEERH